MGTPKLNTWALLSTGADTDNLESSCQWLPARHENSKNLIVNLPIILQNTAHGQKIAAVDPAEVSKFLDLDRDAIDRLTKRFLYIPPKPPALKRIPLDRRALAEQWKALLDSGAASNRSDLARKLGVSRAWISKVMNDSRDSRPRAPRKEVED